MFGKLYANKGYISQSLFGHMWDNGVHIVTGLRSNMRQRLMSLYDRIMLRKRSIIESINDMLRKVPLLVHSRHLSVHNFIMNQLTAMGAYCFFSTKPEVNFDYEAPESNGQLLLLQSTTFKNQATWSDRLIIYVSLRTRRWDLCYPELAFILYVLAVKSTIDHQLFKFGICFTT